MQVKPDDKKNQKVLISLPKGFLRKVDEVADEEDRCRSELVREALRQYFRNREDLSPQIHYGQR